MKKFIIFSILLSLKLSTSAKNKIAEDYYVSAFNEISAMLSGKDSISIKRAVFLSEWAYYAGKLDYQKDFCNEIDRITNFIKLFYDVNKLNKYKTGKQMALNEYFFRPYSENGYKPYTYDFENFVNDDANIENQFVSRVLKTHKGQCRSLPW